MRTLLLAGGIAALIAVPSAALADTIEQVPETDPTAEEAAPSGVTTTSALHAEGRGTFRFEGSGGLVVSGRGVVRVRDDSTGGDLVVTPGGFGAASAPGRKGVQRFTGEGMLVLDGSAYTVTVAGRFTADAAPTATHASSGVARVTGSGSTILQGGVPVPFWASQRILLTTGPMSVDLAGRGAREWWTRPHRGGGKRVTVRRVVVTKRVEDGRTVAHRRTVTVKRWWKWDGRAPGATWRLNGPAAGTVALTTISGRVRVWDRSTAKDLAVTVPAGTATTTLKDGSVVYSGLRGASVTIAGTGFRMKVRAFDVEGTFTPVPGSLARSFVRGGGTFDAGAATDVRAGGHGGVRVLLQAGSPA